MSVSTADQHSFFYSIPVAGKPAPRKPPPRKLAPHLKRLHSPSVSPPPSPPATPAATPATPASPATPINPSSPCSTDSDIPVNPFHITPTSRRGHHVKRFEALLSSHNLPVPPRKPSFLRTKHQACLSTILYKSLLSNDFGRASRAFGLLLRGKDMDIRDVWEIGLDILLKRNREEGREKAVEFLKRMTLFFPYRSRTHSHHPSVSTGREKEERKRVWPSALEFQPTLFKLLITLSPYAQENPPRLNEKGDETHPERIREEIREIMLTPPWCNMVELWALRGMVCEWLVDLEVAEGEREKGKAKEGEGEEDGDEGERFNREDAEREERVMRLREEARTCWEGVRERGGEVPEGIELEEE